jgi:hypothetical protein
MKKLLYLLSISFLMLQACSSGESSDSNESSAQLVGKWEAFQVGEFPPGTVITNSTPLVPFQFACPTYKDYWQFGSQGSFKAVTYNSSCAEGGGIGTYTKTDNILNIYQNNVLQVSMEIISLTSNILKVKFPSPATGTPNAIMVESFKKI